MRPVLLTSLALLMAGCAGQPQPNFRHGPPAGSHGRAGHGGGPGGHWDGQVDGVRGRLFISPMGEPFRADRGGEDPAEIWFRNADTDHDGALSRAEFSRDAERFFVVLDRRHDGEIDPDDIEYYETVLLPEIRVGGGGGVGARAAGGGGRGGGHRGGGRGGGGRGGGGGRRGGGAGGQDAGQGSGEARPAYARQGAARFSYFDYPEPVTVADTNFNRGVDPTEFQHAADVRFAMLDKNGDGKIEHDELPHVSPGFVRRRAPGHSGAMPLGAGDEPAERQRETP